MQAYRLVQVLFNAGYIAVECRIYLTMIYHTKYIFNYNTHTHRTRDQNPEFKEEIRECFFNNNKCSTNVQGIINFGDVKC